MGKLYTSFDVEVPPTKDDYYLLILENPTYISRIIIESTIRCKI